MKLHLGCGERYLNGYVHVDIAEFDHIDFIRPVDDLSCFKKNTVSEIYASHVYESSESLESIVGPLYGKWDIGNNQYIYHKTVYDFTSLKQVLEEVGFKNISYWDWKNVFREYKDFDDHAQAYYPHMQKDSGIHVSLNLQCEK